MHEIARRILGSLVDLVQSRAIRYVSVPTREDLPKIGAGGANLCKPEYDYITLRKQKSVEPEASQVATMSSCWFRVIARDCTVVPWF